jgi:hypothetical protein
MGAEIELDAFAREDLLLGAAKIRPIFSTQNACRIRAAGSRGLDRTWLAWIGGVTRLRRASSVTIGWYSRS